MVRALAHKLALVVGIGVLLVACVSTQRLKVTGAETTRECRVVSVAHDSLT